MDRRSLITILVGVLATLSGFATTAMLRQTRCADAGGQWRAAAKQCVLPSGGLVPVDRATDMLWGIGLALALGFMLFRIVLFATGRARRH